MTGYLLGLVVMAAILLPSACSDRNYSIEQSRRSVVSLTTRYVDTGMPTKLEKQNGSGFFVSRQILITALHVVNSMRNEVAQYPEGRVQIYVERLNIDGSLLFSVPATVSLTDEKSDLALLTIEPGAMDEHIDSGQLSVLQVSNMEPDVGENVIMSGFRGDEISPFTSVGTVSNVSKRDKSTGNLPQFTVFSDLTSLPGNSGAAIISTKNGKVIGVQLGALNWSDTPTRMAYAANPKSINRLISIQQGLAPGTK